MQTSHMMFVSVHFRLLSTTPNMCVTNGLFLSGKGYKTIGIPIKNSTGRERESERVRVRGKE